MLAFLRHDLSTRDIQCMIWGTPDRVRHLRYRQAGTEEQSIYTCTCTAGGSTYSNPGVQSIQDIPMIMTNSG